MSNRKPRISIVGTPNSALVAALMAQREKIQVDVVHVIGIDLAAPGGDQTAFSVVNRGDAPKRRV